MPGPGDISHAGIRITDLTDLAGGHLAARRLYGAPMTSSIITPDLVDLGLEAPDRQTPPGSSLSGALLQLIAMTAAAGRTAGC
jgi:hypothetical protein